MTSVKPIKQPLKHIKLPWLKTKSLTAKTYMTPAHRTVTEYNN